jgi:hypothetical protein
MSYEPSTWPPPSIQELAIKQYCTVELICNGLCAKLVPKGPTIAVFVDLESPRVERFKKWIKEIDLIAVRGTYVQKDGAEILREIHLRGDDIEEKMKHCPLITWRKL